MALVPFTGQLDLKPFDGKLDDESPSMWDELKGGGEELLHLGTGAVGGLAGGLTYLGGLATGDKDAAMYLKHNIEDKMTYQPRTKAGKELQQIVDEGMQQAIEAGGHAVEGMNSASGLNFDPEAADAIGRAGTEMAMNVVDPLMAVHPFLKGHGVELPMDHAAKIEPTLKPFEGTLDKVEPVLGQQGDLFPTNPYDVGGHVTASDQGRPSTIDNPQGDLFGGQQLEQPVPKEQPIPESIVQEPLPKAELSPENPAMSEAFKQAQIEKSYQDAEKTAQIQKDTHYQALEELATAQRAGEIDYQHVKDMGDKTLMDPVSNDKMASAIRDGNLSDAIKAIAENHPERTYRDLALYLQDKVGDIKTQLHPEAMIKAGDRDVSGYFDPNTGVVGYSGIGASSPHTVMHETVHALTSQFMQDRPNDVRVVAVKDLYNKMSDKLVGEFPGVVNAREFVAEAFSNPKFQDFLKAQRIDNRSVFQRFVDGVKTMLGMKTNVDTTVSNALTHAIDLSKQVIEASDKATRQSIMENFKSAGMNNKLADLMAHAPEDKPRVEVVQHGSIKQVASKIPGLSDPISDFKFYDKPTEEIIKMAQESPDISGSLLEKASHQLQAGGLFESLKTRNPVVKYTYERITRAFQEADHNIKVNLTDPKTGLKRYMRDMSPDMKGEIHSIMMLNEGQKEFSSHELAERGFNEKQIAYYNKYRELSQQFFTDLNTRRVAMGLEPMDQRVAHMAGRFMGDFYHEVKAWVPHETTGIERLQIVGRISGTTRWELTRAVKFMKEQHPDWDFGTAKYNSIGKGRNPADRFGGLMEAINFITKTDVNTSALMESYKDYIQKDALNYLNATRHARDKTVQPGGIKGSEGNKPWLDTVKNAEQGMKAQLSYFEQGYQWMALEKAVGDLKPILGNETLARETPNAIRYANAYKDHAMGLNQGKFSDVVNMSASFIGEHSWIGHSNLLKANNFVKHELMQKFMGYINLPFTVTQMMQPLQAHPAMVMLLKNRGLEFSASHAQLKAMETYTKSILQEYNLLQDSGFTKLDSWEQSALQYAKEMGVFDVKMSDHTKDINVSPIWETKGKIADANIVLPEHLTRGNAFLFYSHILKDAGVPIKDIFGAAENMTNMTMVNYHPAERPMGYAKLGWIGDVASTLTRYKHNQLSQVAFYAHEGIRAEQGLKSASPLGTFLGTSLAMGGIMGMFAFNEADTVYQLFREYIMKSPDTLYNQLFKHNVPEFLTHGVFSSIGLDMTSRFSNANLIPDSLGKAIIPYGSAVLDMTDSTGRFLLDPTNGFKAKQFVKSVAPQSAQGLLENHFFTDKKADGKNLYINSTDGPNLGKGRVERTEGDMNLRAWGFRDIRESKELAKNYSDSQIQKAHSNIADNMVEKAKYSILGNNMTNERMQGLIKQAADHGMSPDSFVGKLTQWSVDHQLTQSQQQMLRDAQKGYQGAFNIQQGQR